MALNFPDSPTLNQVYTDSTSGFSYQWNGTVWISYAAASTGNIRVLDDISGSFDGVTQTFALTSSGTPISPPNPQSVIVNLGGVVQDASDDYTISGSNIVFSTAPVNGLSFSAVVLGVAVPVGVSTGDAYFRQVYSPVGVQTSFVFTNGYGVGYLDVYQNGVKLVPSVDYTATDGINFSLTTPAQPGDNVEAVGYRVTSVAITNGSLNSLNVSGDGVIAGTTTLGTVGAGGTTLTVEGNARVTGILTVGTASLTLNGNTNTINGVTISSGIITATSFSGDGSGLTGVGIGTDGSVNTTGIITASSFSGDGSGLTGVGIGTTANLQTNSLVVAGIVTAQSYCTVLGALTSLGTAVEGGRLICKASSVGWIVAPNTSEVYRSWTSRNDANTRAQQVSGCTGWFVPTCGQLQNPGYACRNFWDSLPNNYWSSTEINASYAFRVNFSSAGNAYPSYKPQSLYVRAFRCVTY